MRVEGGLTEFLNLRFSIIQHLELCQMGILVMMTELLGKEGWGVELTPYINHESSGVPPQSLRGVLKTQINITTWKLREYTVQVCTFFSTFWSSLH